MEKGMTNSVIALIGISVLVTALVLSRPFELENEKSPIYSFIEKTDYKKQVIWFMANQAITEAFADHALEQTEGGNCEEPSNPGELDTKTNGYLKTINDTPENYECEVTFLGSRLDQPGNEGLEQYNVAVEIKCTAGKQDEALFVKVKKNYDYNMTRSNGSGPCTVTIRDLDSGNTFPP
ncbi:MAG: hypothetical protein Q7K34_02075 [archaeon]|nr:hypothetical protein [archaeon]